MHHIAFATLVALLVTDATASSQLDSTSRLGAAEVSLAVREQFSRFTRRFRRRYADAAEEAHRLRVFAANQRRAAAIAATNPLATFGADERNPFADVTAEEFRSTHHNAAEPLRLQARWMELQPRVRIPPSTAPRGTQIIDWRTKGAVTPVKNQGQCGSCWSFSTTGNIEGQWFLAGHQLTSLSEQELVSCDTIDSGCGGGLQSVAFDWLVRERSGRISTEASWNYTSGTTRRTPVCPRSALEGRTTGAVISGFQVLPSDEDLMASWMLTGGPLAISVDATKWQFYNGGVMTDCGGKFTDHAVLLVGFNDAASPPYWIVKNSWAASWGEAGYIRIEKGTNQCLVKQQPCTAVVSPAGAATVAPRAGVPQVMRQYVCSSASCNESQCVEAEYAEGECVRTGPTAAFRSSCATDGRARVAMFASPDCSGTPVGMSTQVSGQCTAHFDGRGEVFMKTVCQQPAPVPLSFGLVTDAFTNAQCTGTSQHSVESRTGPGPENCMHTLRGPSFLVQCSADHVTVLEFPGFACSGKHNTTVTPNGECVYSTLAGGYARQRCVRNF